MIVTLTLASCTGLAGEPEIVMTVPVQQAISPVSEIFDEVINLDEGALIFAENCIPCHGTEGKGDGEFVLSGQVENVPDFTNSLMIENISLQEWFDTITNGRIDRLMPPWKDALSGRERWAAALYTYTLSYDPSLVTQGQSIYETQCSDCHGIDGNGNEDGVSLQRLISFTELELLEAIEAHQINLQLSPQRDETDLKAVVQSMRLLSATSEKLPDPNILASHPEPAITEEFESSESIGTLRGRVIQGTEGGASVEGLESIIHIYDNQLQEQISEFIVGADGVYQYEEVVIRSDFAYRMTAVYNGITYSSPVITRVLCFGLFGVI
jgi:mono/diheme cytochrome c family protein